jgi:hypothetical protein
MIWEDAPLDEIKMLQFVDYYAGRWHARCLEKKEPSACPTGSSTIRLHCLIVRAKT